MYYEQIEKPKSFLQNDAIKTITEESVKEGKRRNIETRTDIDTDVLERHFQIIEAYSNQKYFFCDDFIEKEKITEVEYKKKVKVKKREIEDNSENNYFVTDIHGDLFSLLEVLTGNKDNTKNIARFKKDQPCVIYRDINEIPPMTYSDISELNDAYLKNLVPIPNLEPNPEFQGNFILGGDIIDRGKETESCFYTLENLINENKLLGKKKKNIFYEIGNHEEYLLKIEFKDNTLFTSQYYDYELRMGCMKKAIQNMIQNNDIQLMYTNNDNIYCHAVINRTSILKAFEGILAHYFSDKILNKYFTQEKIYIAQILTLQKKIENKDEELTSDDLSQLVNILNTLTKYYFAPECQNEKIQIIFGDGSRTGLLWDREKNENKKDEIKGINLFFVGHDVQSEHEVRCNGQYCFADVGTSNGYKFYNSFPTRTAANIVEVNSNSKIISYYKEFDRAKFENRYRYIEDSLNMITKEDQQKLIEKQKKQNENINLINSFKKKDFINKEVNQTEFYKEQFKLTKNINEKLVFFQMIIDSNREIIEKDPHYAFEIVNFAFNELGNMSVSGAIVKSNFFLKFINNNAYLNINIINEIIVKTIQIINVSQPNTNIIQNCITVLNYYMKKPSVRNLKINDDIAIKIIKTMNTQKYDLYSEKNENKNKLSSISDVKIFVIKFIRNCENKYLINKIEEIIKNNPTVNKTIFNIFLAEIYKEQFQLSTSINKKIEIVQKFININSENIQNLYYFLKETINFAVNEIQNSTIINSTDTSKFLLKIVKNNIEPNLLNIIADKIISLVDINENSSSTIKNYMVALDICLTKPNIENLKIIKDNITKILIIIIKQKDKLWSEEQIKIFLTNFIKHCESKDLINSIESIIKKNPGAKHIFNNFLEEHYKEEYKSTINFFDKIHILQKIIDVSQDKIKNNKIYTKEIIDFALNNLENVETMKELSRPIIYSNIMNGNIDSNLLNEVVNRIIPILDINQTNLYETKAYIGVLDTFMIKSETQDLKIKEEDAIKIIKIITKENFDLWTIEKTKIFLLNLANFCENLYMTNAIQKTIDDGNINLNAFQQNINGEKIKSLNDLKDSNEKMDSTKIFLDNLFLL